MEILSLFFTLLIILFVFSVIFGSASFHIRIGNKGKTILDFYVGDEEKPNKTDYKGINCNDAPL